MRIDRVYTKGGDKGETSLIGGERVSKADPRLDCYGRMHSHPGRTGSRARRAPIAPST